MTSIYEKYNGFFQDANNNSVQLEWLSSNGPQTAEILYKCSPTSAFDVAILKTDVPGPKEICRISRTNPRKGRNIFYLSSNRFK
jgi:hypothetical protein